MEKKRRGLICALTNARDSAAASMIRRSILVSLLSGLNSTAGFLSQVVTAHYFGTSPELDAYFAGGTIPSIAMGMAGAAVGFVLIPTLMERDHTDCPMDERRVFSGFINTAMLGVALFGMMCGAQAENIVSLTNPGLSQRHLDLAIGVFRLSWIAAVLSIAVAGLLAVHNIRSRFVLSTGSMALPALGTIIAAWLCADRFGVQSLVYGAIAGALLQLGVLARGCAGVYSPTVFVPDARAREALGSLIPVIVFLLPHTALYLVDRYFASLMEPGAISYLGYGSRITIAVSGLVSVGASVVNFPTVAAHLGQGDRQAARGVVEPAARVLVLAAVAVVAIAYGLREPLITYGFEHGSFTVDSKAGVLAVLPWFLWSAVSMALLNLLMRVVFAVRNRSFMIAVGIGQLGSYALLVFLLSSWQGYVGIAIAYFVNWLGWTIVIGVYVHTILVKRNYGAPLPVVV